MKKSSLLFAALAAAVVVASPLAANVANAEEAESTGSWKQDGKGWWYEFNDGTYAKDGIYSTSDEDVKYMFDADGYLTTGWHWMDDKVYGDGDWYYSNNKGELQSGWQKIGGSWYYLNTYSYYMYSGGKYTIDDTKYYFTPTGVMVDGWYNYDPAGTYGNWKYCNGDGSAYDGWLNYNGAWYYFDEGDMYEDQTVTKYQKPDGSTYYSNWKKDADDTKVETYYFGRDGKMIDGWYYTEYETATGYKSNNWKYAAGGVVKEGWVRSGNKWYYTDSEGNMKRDCSAFVGDYDNVPKYPNSSDFRGEDGWIDWDKYEAAIGKYYKDREEFYRSNTYIFDANGAMVEGGWYASKNTYGTTWYYANSDGTAYTGWTKSGNNYYYIDRGVMLTNTMTPDGYYVDANGIWK